MLESNLIVLASASPYRQNLLKKIALPFRVKPANIIEHTSVEETGSDNAQRLASEKARFVANQFAENWVLGSDQVAVTNDEILRKPGDRDANIAQLEKLSEKTIDFFTAITLYRAKDDSLHEHCQHCIVQMGIIDSRTAKSYVDAEPAWDCVGGFKAEGLGISLLKEIRTTDPTALIGLPLIALCRLLRHAGYVLP